LHEANVRELLDLTLGAYTLVTYRLADLHPNLRNAMECVIVKRTTDPHEIGTLLNMLQAKGGCTAAMSDLASLGLDEAVLLPGMRETGGQCLKFELFPRLTSHVRHKAKYLDVQLLVDQGFWFTEDGETVAGPARTLKDFLTLLDLVPPGVLTGHALRGDFSRWIAEVFHDHALASEIRKAEQRFRLGHIHDLTQTITKLVQERYEFSPELAGESRVTPLSQALGPNHAIAAHSGV